MEETPKDKYNWNRIEFKASGPLLEALSRNDSPGLAAKEMLETYLYIIEAETKRFDFTESEASLIVDALNGLLFEPHTLSLVWANIDDAIRLDGLDRKWGVDGPTLIEKLRSMCPGEQAALVDAVIRFWRGQPQVGTDGVGQGLRRVGLVK